MRRNILNLNQPDYAGQIFALSQRLAAVELRLAEVETLQASYGNRITVLEDGGTPTPSPGPIPFDLSVNDNSSYLVLMAL